MQSVNAGPPSSSDGVPIRGPGWVSASLRRGEGQVGGAGVRDTQLGKERTTGAALMKGPAAGRPPGYADHHSNWPDEMRRIRGEVRRRRTEDWPPPGQREPQS